MSLVESVTARMAGYPLYSQESAKDTLVIVKLFDAYGSGTWYLTEYDPEDNRAFCYVTGLAYDEWGYVSIRELEDIRIGSVPRIELDLYFEPKPLSQVIGT